MYDKDVEAIPPKLPRISRYSRSLYEEDGKQMGKSQQGKAQSAARKAAQANRGSNKFKGGSNVHNGASKGQSGQPKGK